MVVLPAGVGCWAGNGGGAGPRLLLSAGLSVLCGGGALWRLLRGLWELCWVGWYTRQGWRRGGCMGVLHRFSDGWALVILRGDGGGVAPELLRGAVTASGAVPWLPGLSSFAETVTALCGVSCGGWVRLSRGVSWRRWGPSRGRWGWAWRGSVGVAGIVGSLRGL